MTTMVSAQLGTACQAMATRDVVKPTVSLGTKSLLPVRLGTLGRKGATVTVRAEGKDLKQNDAAPSAEAAAMAAAQAGGDLSHEQQQALSRIYQFLVQDMNSKARTDRNVSLQRLLETYQVLLWRPAELLNGRMAMVGFTAGALRQALSGETVWGQVATTGGFAYLFAYLVVLLAGFLNRQFGGPSQGIGPFTQSAELINGRAAMVGYAVLAYTGYNVELTRTIVALAQQLAHSVPGMSV